MKKEYIKKGYAEGGAEHKFDNAYDYMLFRQDWNGAERIYFNRDELQIIIDKISTGEILIHMNYSVLYARNQSLLNEVSDIGCYATVKS